MNDREAFEAWAQSQVDSDELSTQRNSDGYYRHPFTQFAYRGFIAALAHARQQASYSVAGGSLNTTPLAQQESLEEGMRLLKKARKMWVDDDSITAEEIDAYLAKEKS